MPGFRRESGARRVVRLLGALPGMVVGLLPIGACPACWPAYGAVPGAAGLGFLLDRAYLFPVTLAALGMALVALGYAARSRRGHGPLAVGAAGAASIVVGKFGLGLAWAGCAGVALLLGATSWSVWPRRVGAREGCPACRQTGEDTADAQARGLQEGRKSP